MNERSVKRRQRGFLIIAGVFLVVVLAGLLTYMATVSNTSQTASVADLNSARAYQAARAGTEWAMYLVLQTAGGAGTLKTLCEAGSVTKNLTFGSTLAAFTATVTCSTATFTEGATTVTTYSIVSNACNLPNAGNCPNAVTTSPTYVEREITIAITN
jgi:MSHA biogenesis protein MshP